MARVLTKIALQFACVLLLVPTTTTANDQERRPPSRTTASAASERRVDAHLARIRQDQAALRAFLQAFPKGADLHSHLSGAVYAESYIRWAADLPLCIELATLAFVEAAANSPGTCRDPIGQRPASQVSSDPILFREVIDAFSTRHWQAGRGSGHDRFFDTFSKFDGVLRTGRDGSPVLTGRAVAEVAHRAALQNVQHLELMVSFDSRVDVSSEGVAWDSDQGFRVLRERLLASALQGRVADRRQWLDAVDAERRAALGCGTPTAKPGCDLPVRYIAYALRGLPPSQVFAQATFAFEMAAADGRVAGVNLVMPEDWHVPMRDYELHMRMFRFLRSAYPGVNVALHAGELVLGLVPPETLGRHVRQAIEIGGAQRIGHGTDVMHDVDPAGLLQEMARRRIAVEISLSSSDVILGVRGTRHPLRQYLRAGVPVVVATDDEGVARSDLTNEYQRAVEEHGLSYGELKGISRNSIEYSFLPASEKTRLKGELEAAFTRFESTVR